MKSTTSNLIILFGALITVGFLYNRYEAKIARETAGNEYTEIQKYLLGDDEYSLDNRKKPIMWIHVPYEYNARNWLSFGSRSSFNLNQPYLYLTVKSIIKQCNNSFTICIIDDASFVKLIPGWNVDMNSISDPILGNMRTLGLMRLLYIYGGMICPLSFVCIKDLIGLYNKGTSGNKMFVCETIDRNITSTDIDFYPNLIFCGAPKECNTVRELCEYIRRTTSHDYTAETAFLGNFNKWCLHKAQNGKINIIDGVEIGAKTSSDTQIIVDDLLSNNYLDIYQQTYGILIPADEILRRNKFEWFARMSPKQVLETDTIIGNYLLLSISPEQGILEPLETSINKEIEAKYVGFWKTPLYPGLYGLKPNFLGDNLIKQEHTGR